MKYALIGCGRIAVNHIKAVVNNGLELVAVCDLVPEHIDLLFEKTGYTGTPARYTDYRQMLSEHPELELAAIATDSGVHAEIALACLDAGLHVIVEKPMAMSMADADRIIDRARETGARWRSATRTASISPCSACAPPWIRDASAACPTARSMCAGTGTGRIMSRPPGAAAGPATAARS